MKCLICDRDTEAEDYDDDNIPSLLRHRKLLLSMFCKYFNWENNYELKPSQLLSWIPSSSSSSSSSSSVYSNFPFCVECEDKMNDLIDLHKSLGKIQLDDVNIKWDDLPNNLTKILRRISTTVANISRAIIKVAESSTNYSSAPKSKETATKTPRATSRTTRSKSAAKSLGATATVLQFKTPDPKSVEEFRKNIYSQFKPQVIVHDCRKTKKGLVETRATILKRAAAIKRLRKQRKLERQEQLRSIISLELGSSSPKASKRASSVEELSADEKDEEDDVDSDPDFGESMEKKNPNLHRAKETVPGSNIFRYYNWEFQKLSETSYKCLTCDHMSQGQRKNILNHINKYHNNVRPKCEACGLSWGTQESKDQHKCTPPPKRFKVAEEVEPGKFLYLGKYLYQQVDKSSNDQGFEFMCLHESCHKLTKTPDYMRTHIRAIHDASNPTLSVCDICHKTMSTATAVKKHKATVHAESRNEICDICGKGFKDRDTLSRHHMTHLGPFICGFEGCKKQYGNLKALNRHRLDSNHPVPDFDNELDEIEECPICGKKLIGEETLAIHLASLTCGIQKINCHFCAKELSPTKLKRHLKKYCPLNPERMSKMGEEEGELFYGEKEDEEGEQQKVYNHNME